MLVPVVVVMAVLAAAFVLPKCVLTRKPLLSACTGFESGSGVRAFTPSRVFRLACSCLRRSDTVVLTRKHPTVRNMPS